MTAQPQIPPRIPGAPRLPKLDGTLSIGLALLTALALFALVGPLMIDAKNAEVGQFRPRMAPSAEHWLGTDVQGRDVFATLAYATPETLKIGFLAGIVGLGIGLVLGLMAGYFGGVIDAVIRTATDVLNTIPGIALLVVIATQLRMMTVGLMALVIAALAWRYPARAIRSQVLTLRERGYVQIARLNGVGGPEILIKEVLPNLLPYIAASFVATVSQATLSSIGLEALGLGPQNSLTLGMMIYWAQYYAAILRGFWWWWAPPIVIIILIFVGLLFTSSGLDRLVNTRLRRAE
jgi:peptide/nickel transport system permease protein